MASKNALTTGKANWSVNIAAKKAALLMQKAQAAALAVETARKRAYDEMTASSVQIAVPAKARTSTQAFATKDPRHCLEVLGCVDLNAMKTQEYAQLDLVAHKYSVLTLSEALAGEARLYKSIPAASMMAATTVRYVFDVACELAANSEDYAEAKSSLAWHTPQEMLKKRETRGAGVVANSAAAVKLLEKALVVAKKRVQERVEAGEKYDMAMGATAAVVAGVVGV